MKRDFPTAGARVPKPTPIAEAFWQAGVTPDNSSLRAFIDGEPEPLCFAANPRAGWAKVYVPAKVPGPAPKWGEAQNSDFIARDQNGNPATRTRYGRVRLQRVSGE